MRLFHLSLMAFVSLGLTGCMKISTEASFKSDGNFISEADFDFSALQQMTEGLKDLDNESTEMSSKSDFEDFCKTTKEEAKDTKRYRLKSFECRELGKGKFHVKITGQMKDNYLSIKDGVYTLIMDSKDLETDAGNMKDEASIDEADESGLAMLKAMGMDIRQVYTFPVPVTSTEVGRIDGNKVIIELEDFAKIGKQAKAGKSEFKIVAGGRAKAPSIRYHSSKRNKRLQQYHRRYLSPNINKKRSPLQIKTVRPAKISSRRISARHRLASRLRMKGSVRRRTGHRLSRIKKTYYHPFGETKGRGYRGSRR